MAKATFSSPPPFPLNHPHISSRPESITLILSDNPLTSHPKSSSCWIHTHSFFLRMLYHYNFGLKHKIFMVLSDHSFCNSPKCTMCIAIPNYPQYLNLPCCCVPLQFWCSPPILSFGLKTPCSSRCASM